jgi:hypothetical protein
LLKNSDGFKAVIELPNEPIFVAPYPDVPGGVDYLGLRTVNLELMDQFLPGINNVTEEVRPFSVACWIVWAFAELASRQGMTEVHLSDFTAFREKAEVLFNWSHHLHNDDAKMFGKQQVKPDVGSAVPLSFKEWKRKLSWFDAVAYGPSLKSDNGMGFLVQVHAGVFAPTKRGAELAKHLDLKLRQTEGYSVLANLEDCVADEDLADSLYPAWKRSDASEGEREVFKEAFYDSDAIDRNSRMGRRSGAIALISATLEDAESELSEQQIRQLLVVREPSGLPEHQLDQLQSMRASWQALQVRQAFRLAFEVLFGWLEWQVLVKGTKTSGQIVESLMTEIERESPSAASVQDLQAHYSIAHRPSKHNQLLVEQIDETSELDFFTHMDHLLQIYRNSKDGAAIASVHLLLLCATLTEDLKQDERALQFLDLGGTFRLSLGFWSSFVQSNQATSLSDFLLTVTENFLLSQHFGFAAARYSEGKLRLRLTIEDTGLVSLLPGADKVWSPAVTPDRLYTALSLMANSGMVNRSTVGDVSTYSV